MFQVPGRNLAILFAGGVVVQIAGGIVVYLAARAAGIDKSDGGLFILIALLPPMLLLLIWTYLYMRRFEVRGDHLFGLARLSRVEILVALATALVGVALSIVLTLIFHSVLGPPRNPLVELFRAGAEGDVVMIAAFILFGVAVAPVWEELLFRGALYGWLRTRLGILASAAIAGGLHATIHLDLAAIPALFVLFTFFAIVYEHMENLWVPILAHATNNLLSLLAVLAELDL